MLDHIITNLHSQTMFITHYQSLARMAERFPNVLKNVHMRFSEQDDAATGEQNITFLYEVGEGVAHRSYGLNVARLAGLPKTLLEEARRRSKGMEEEEGRKRLTYLAGVAETLMQDGEAECLQHFVAGLEQM